MAVRVLFPPTIALLDRPPSNSTVFSDVIIVCTDADGGERVESLTGPRIHVLGGDGLTLHRSSTLHGTCADVFSLVENLVAEGATVCVYHETPTGAVAAQFVHDFFVACWSSACFKRANVSCSMAKARA